MDKRIYNSILKQVLMDLEDSSFNKKELERIAKNLRKCNTYYEVQEYFDNIDNHDREERVFRCVFYNIVSDEELNLERYLIN